MMSLVETSDGVKISIRHTPRGGERVVIVAPGFFQSKETRTFRRIHDALGAAFDVISMDFRGHGKSGGRYTFSARETEDLKVVVDYARERYGKVGVLGFSFGGSIAVLEAARYRNVDSLVCVGSPMAPAEIEFEWWRPVAIRDGVRGLERGAGARIGSPFLKKASAIDVVSSLGPIPVLFIHGSRDATVKPRHSRGLYERARGTRSLRIFQGASHAQEIFRKFPEGFLGCVRDWFEGTLR